MKVKEYIVMDECLERGVSVGWMRAFKHLDMPDELWEFLEKNEHHIKDAIVQCVSNDIYEHFDFDSDINYIRETE